MWRRCTSTEKWKRIESSFCAITFSCWVRALDTSGCRTRAPPSSRFWAYSRYRYNSHTTVWSITIYASLFSYQPHYLSTYIAPSWVDDEVHQSYDINYWDLTTLLRLNFGSTEFGDMSISINNYLFAFFCSSFYPFNILCYQSSSIPVGTSKAAVHSPPHVEVVEMRGWVNINYIQL